MIPPGDAAPCLSLLALAVLLQAVSGLPMLLRRGSVAAQRCSAALLIFGTGFGLAGALRCLLFSLSERSVLSWRIPFGPAEAGIDPLSALFLVPVCLVIGAAGLYGLGYWPANKHPGNSGKLNLFLGLLAASLTGIFLARNGALFLFAWEIMALAAWFALTTEDEKSEVREAGELYLITAHLGGLALFALFSLLKAATGTMLFPAAGSLSGQSGIAAGIFLAGLIGFGLKAGAMPFHVWLPSAHANAPSHISAVLSGVVLKTGIYGMIRIFSFFYDLPLWWGGTVLVIGVVSGIAGVAFAIGQHDLKRLLAYHSIENIGIILMGLGVALVGQNQGNVPLQLLGLAGALLHVINHATFKALLFLAAGSVIHATGTREIELMGGVGRRLPVSAGLFLVGAVAICGLPPLNGFVSELFVYLASFRAVSAVDGIVGIVAALTAPALALVGGLAVACFVKVYGAVFLGVPRHEAHAPRHEASRLMLFPMGGLALVCALIGILPFGVGFALDAATSCYGVPLPAGGVGGLAPLGLVCLMALGLLALSGLAFFLLYRRAARFPVAVSTTWGCGYLRPTPRMQYTASSFADTLVSWFRFLLCPEVHQKEPEGLFPAPGHYQSHVPETVLERGYLPFLEYLYLKSAPLRHLQHGKLNIYIFYTFLTLVVLLAVTMMTLPGR